MTIDRFPQEVVETLGHYVYRLIDPRNGETFYVGRGQGDRVFAHAKGAYDDANQSAADPKLKRIHEIRALGMDVAHVIHRHGMSAAAANEVEAALIDAYPGLTNRVIGSGSKDRGARHVEEIMLEHSAAEFMVGEPLILIKIGQLWNVWGVYEAVRGLWTMNLNRACQYRLVLAYARGVVRGAYRPKQWMHGSPESFPLHNWSADKKKYERKICFDGTEAEPEVWKSYVGKRIPAKYRPRKGAANPVRYLHP